MNNKLFSQAICHWQKRHGRHDLPWQKNKTAYRVWVSEIMLQQTQVATVIPYYQRFMQAFPSLKQLAMATENTVLEQWTGLGYYRRAQNLHRCAKLIIEKYSGRFPKDQKILETLPGIGRSTAAAIASFAFNQNTCILDGNVKRIFARAFMIDGDVKQTAVQKKLWELAQMLKPNGNTAIYNQGLMDLGATICTRRHPSCCQCPLQSSCLARNNHVIDNYPAKTKTIKKITQPIYLINVIHNKQHFLLQRPNHGIWAKLWCFPCFDNEKALQQWAELHFKQKANQIDQYIHQLTHRRLHIKLYQLEPIHLSYLSKLGGIWYDLKQTAPGGLPKPIQRALQSSETS